jgi:hypothetical protein
MPHEGRHGNRIGRAPAEVEGRDAEPKTGEAYPVAASRPLCETAKRETAKQADPPVAHRDRPCGRPKSSPEILMKL